MATIVWTLVCMVLIAWGVRSVVVPEFVSGRVVRRSRTDATPAPTLSSVPAGSATTQVAADGLLIKQLVWARTLEADFGRPYPLLAAIDAARGDAMPEFARDPQAERLERLAHNLVTRSWSDLVSMMSQVDQARFDALCSTLEWEQRSRLTPSSPSVKPLEVLAA